MTIDIVGHLTELGFTEYEARAYSTLVKRNPLTGYEVAKISGVPRPNVYSVIERLQQKGAVLTIRDDSGVKYAPVPPGEMLGRLARSFKSHVQEAERALTQIQNVPQADYIMNLRGYDNIMAKAKQLVEMARRQVLAAWWPVEFQFLTPALGDLKTRGVESTILCFQGGAEQTAGCSGQMYRLSVAKDTAVRWLVLVADESELLAAEVPVGDEARAAWTRQGLFIAMGVWYVRHSIAVAEIVRSLGAGLRDHLDERAMAALVGHSREGGDGKPWLESLLQGVEMGEREVAKST
ncbi:MAG: TrmB family transcriptional regulator [Chloroflexi bacterium]|nr:TrmB family transcriptional regulator [Chloroflexota bacterium]